MCKDKLKSALEALKRECVKVVPCSQGFSPEHAADIRFGGSAYAEKDEEKHICPNCGKLLTFVFQYREKYDKSFRPSGSLYSVYYCFDCMPIGRPSEEQGQWAVIEHKNADASKFVAGYGDNGTIKPCDCELQRVNILPDYETLEEKYPDVASMCEELDEEDPMAAYEDVANELGLVTQPGTVLGGYPIWLQGEGSQICPVDKGEMEFCAQIDSEEMANLMFGDAGCLYVFRCKEHNKFEIEMQCF